jgi:hypothetical protein
MHAEALLWAGTPDEANAELNRYLDGRDLKKMPPRVRALWGHIQERKKDEAAFLAAKTKAKARREEPIDYLQHSPQNLPDFEPAADQAQLGPILTAVEKNVSDLFASLPNICSVEKVHQERLNRNGKTDAAQEYQYRYLLLAPNQRWGLSIDEYRSDMQGNETPQSGLDANHMLTEGFVSAPLVFHPAYQSGSTFRLLGRQKVKGRNTFVIAYAQNPASSRIYGTFKYGKTIRTTYTQGLAWIDSENYQIIRLTSDLLIPLPQIGLERETTEIEFSEVHFKRLTQRFWLPDAVTVTLDWDGKVLRNKHAYSDFLVSNVDFTQRIGKPKDVEKSAKEANEPAPRNNPLENHSLSLVPPANKP